MVNICLYLLFEMETFSCHKVYLLMCPLMLLYNCFPLTDVDLIVESSLQKWKTRLYQEEEDFFYSPIKLFICSKVELLHNCSYQFTDVTNGPCRVVSYYLHYEYSTECNIKDFFSLRSQKGNNHELNLD